MNQIPAFQEENDYIRLLEILIKTGEANRDTQSGGNDRLLDAEGLFKKFIGHAASALYLFRGTTLSCVNVADAGISFFDAGSINVLGRAALEAFLVFHHIFIDPQSGEEKNFRYYSWLLASFVDRQKFPSQTDEGKQLLNDEKKTIDALTEEIKRSAVFKQLEKRKQEKVLEGEWRLHSWREIGLTAGLSNILAQQFYGHLCAYAHSGCQSAQQVGNAESTETQKALSVATMKLIMIAMANMIKSYCQMFEKSREAIDQDAAAKKLIDKWVYIGQPLQKEF